MIFNDACCSNEFVAAGDEELTRENPYTATDGVLDVSGTLRDGRGPVTIWIV